jgi:DHA2 family multidrug resistance protein
VVNSLLIQNTQVNHARNPLTAAGRAALDAMTTQQAQIISYIDDYKLLMIASL